MGPGRAWASFCVFIWPSLLLLLHCGLDPHLQCPTVMVQSSAVESSFLPSSYILFFVDWSASMAVPCLSTLYNTLGCTFFTAVFLCYFCLYSTPLNIQYTCPHLPNIANRAKLTWEKDNNRFIHQTSIKNNFFLYETIFYQSSWSIDQRLA